MGASVMVRRWGVRSLRRPGRLRAGFAVLVVMLSTACAAPQAPSANQPIAPTAVRASKTLVLGIRAEPASLSQKPLTPGSTTLTTVRGFFNLGLTLVDDTDTPTAALAEALPRLNSDSWRLLPDGRMETTYRLRAGLTWQDGTPLSAQDFAFAWNVYRTPELGMATSLPQGLMDEVTAPDAATVFIRWRRPFPDAGALGNTFPPLPRHVLESEFQREAANTFTAHPFWTREYLGLGPYRLTKWEPGAFLEGEAFAGYLKGRPKIDRVRVVFIGDANTALANLLAGEVHILADVAITSQQLPAVKRDWLSRGAGQALVEAGIYRAAYFQFRPDLVNPRALLDLRVRKALAHTVDKQSINDAIYDGGGLPTDSPIPARMWFFSEVDRAIAKYPLDLRRAEALLAEAGITRGPDGGYRGADGSRFAMELKTNASAQFETEMHIVADGWRKTGIDVSEAVTPTALVQNGEVRATYPGVYIFGSGLGDAAIRNFTADNVPKPENRWIGSNRGAWLHPDYDRLVEAYNTTLDRPQRAAAAAQAMKLLTEDVGSIALEFDPNVIAVVAALTGPKEVGPEGAVSWNVHEWELK